MSKIVKTNSMNNMMNNNNNNNGGYNMRTSKYEQQSNEAVIERIMNGTATLKDLTNSTEAKIDFAKCSRKIKTIQLIYNAGSKVGACTVVAGNMFTVDLTEETKEAYKKALIMLKERNEHVPYESVWVYGVNKFDGFDFATGHKYTYYVVTDDDIEMLQQRIERMDYNSVTLDELKQLQADLPPFVRAWQESSIDVSKDKSKVFVKNFEDFFKKIDTVSTYLKAHADGMEFNLDDNKQLHKTGKTDRINFDIKLPSLTNVCNDMLGNVNLTIRKAALDFFNGNLRGIYTNANRDFYAQFADECLAYPELALYMQQIITLMKQAFSTDAKIAKDDYAFFRNAIYSKAANYNVPVEDVVKVMASVAMRKITRDEKARKINMGTANVETYRPWAVANIFENEYVALRTGVKPVEELTLAYVERDTVIAENEAIEFDNGVSLDGKVEVEELFTGVAYNKGGKLVHDIDIYSYEEVSTIITVKTYAEGATVQDRTEDNGESMINYLNENDTITIAGKNNNILIANDGVTLLGQAIPSPELMPTGKARVLNVVRFIDYKTTENKEQVILVELN